MKKTIRKLKTKAKTIIKKKLFKGEYDPNKQYPKLFVGFTRKREGKVVKEGFDKYNRIITTLLVEEVIQKDDHLAAAALAKGPLTAPQLEKAMGHGYVSKMLWWLKKHGFIIEKGKNPAGEVIYIMKKAGTLPIPKKIMKKGISSAQPHELTKINPVSTAASMISVNKNDEIEKKKKEAYEKTLGDIIDKANKKQAEDDEKKTQQKAEELEKTVKTVSNDIIGYLMANDKATVTLASISNLIPTSLDGMDFTAAKTKIFDTVNNYGGIEFKNNTFSKKKPYGQEEAGPSVPWHIKNKASKILDQFKTKGKVSSTWLKKNFIADDNLKQALDHLKKEHNFWVQHSQNVPGKKIYKYIGEKSPYEKDMHSSSAPSYSNKTTSAEPTAPSDPTPNQLKLAKAKKIFDDKGTVTFDELQKEMDQSHELTIKHLGYNGYQLEIDPNKKTYKLLNKTAGSVSHKNVPVDMKHLLKSIPEEKHVLYPEFTETQVSSKHLEELQEIHNLWDTKEFRDKLRKKIKNATVTLDPGKTWNDPGTFSHGLTPDEGKALQSYTGSGYSSLNLALYEGNGIANDEGHISKMDKNVSNSIKKMKPIDEDFHVYSGIKVKDPREIMDESGIFHVPAYMSTSLKLSTAQGFSSGTKVKINGVELPANVEHVLKIKIPKGSKFAYVKEISGHSSEEECILHKNCKIRIVDKPKMVSLNSYGHMTSSQLLWEAELVHDGTS